MYVVALQTELKTSVCEAADPQIRNVGIPSTLSICLGDAENLHCHLGASKEHWPKGSHLQQISITARKHEISAGTDFLTNLVLRFNQKFAGAGDRRQRFLDAAFAEAILPMPKHTAQAFVGSNFDYRDRCLRCRGTFGFNWVHEEKARLSYKDSDVKDFEGFLLLGSEGPDAGTVGKCAEHALVLRCLDKI
ncbi:MAG: hypothetical protein M1829_003445 [Trizodia sp. TS-e1964]|nr:MAG: hypothetical protein M1829_003445 [Trizodia sp. TS-e1964]